MLIHRVIKLLYKQEDKEFNRLEAIRLLKKYLSEGYEVS